MVVRRDLASLCVATAFASTATTMLVLAVPLLALEFGMGATGVGLIVSSAFVLPLVLAVPFGRVVDRFGARAVLIAGFVTFLVALGPAVATPGLATLVFGYVVATLGQLASVVASQALVADLGQGTGREAAYGWWTTSVAGGQFVGPLVAGIILDTLTRSMVFVAPMLCIAVAIAMALVVRTRTATSGGASVPLVRSGNSFGVLKDRTVMIAILTSSSALWAITVFATYFPVRLAELTVPATTIGALMSLRALASVVIRPFMSPAVRLLGGRERTVVFTLAGLGAGLVALGFADALPAFAMVCVVLGIATGLSQPVSMVMVADRVAPRERGTVLGIRLTGNRLAQLVAPIALVLVAEAFGLGWMFVAHGVVVLGAAVVLHRLVRGAPPDTASESAPH